MEAGVLLEGLNEEQRVAVTTEAAPLCILAGAGSGKTRVLTRRIAHRAATGSLDPRRVLVLTFTRAAAAELVERLRGLGLRDKPTAGTFHAIAYAQLRRRWAEQRIAAPTLLDRKVGFVARQLPKGTGARAVEVATEIEWAKARVIAPAAYAHEAVDHRREPSVGIDVVARAYEAYEAAKRKAGLVDFDDLLWQAIHALENDPDSAAATRWQHQHLFVDEFQDVNPLQLRLLQAWLGPRRDLCVVGDPNQAIYAWNGADPGLITRFGDHFPGAEVVALPHNHRSTPQVLALANRVLDAGALPGVRLVPTRPDGPDPTVTATESSEAEVAAIAATVVADHDRNVPWSQQAVLVRTNAQAAAIADGLRAAGVPVRVRAQTPFLDLPPVKEALATLRRRGFVEGLAAIDSLGDTLGDEGEGLELVDDGAAAVAELVRLAGEYSAVDPRPSPTGFAGWLATAVGDDAGDASSAVVVATFHAAKGLEWPVVHLAGVEDGSVPHAHARTPEALAEERRLLYVALTRSERVLRLWWAQTRTFGTKVARRRPSPFIAELQPVLDAMARRSATVDGGQEVASALDAVRAARARPPVAPEPLAAALDDWRRVKARASRLPVGQVLGDDALAALCARRPDDDEGVAAIIGPIRAPRFGRELLALIRADGAPAVRTGTDR